MSRVVVVVVFEVKTLNTRSLSDCFDQLCLDSWDSKYGCRLRQIVAEDIYVYVSFSDDDNNDTRLLGKIVQFEK